MLTYPPLEVSESIEHDAQSSNWVTAQQLVSGRELKGFARIGCGTCAAACFPEAPEDVVQLAADQISFLFLFDDLYAEGQFRRDPDGLHEAMKPYIAIARGEADTVNTPYSRALGNLVQRARAQAPEYWVARFGASFEEYCNGCVLEARYRASGQTPTLSAYMELRRGSIGMSPMFDLMELSHGAFLTPSEFNRETVIRLRHLGADLSALVNDLSSLEKEEDVGDVCNAVIVMQSTLDCDRERALDAIAELHNELLGELQALEARLTADAAHSALALYARSIRQWVHGHYGWILSSKRYASRRAAAN